MFSFKWFSAKSQSSPLIESNSPHPPWSTKPASAADRLPPGVKRVLGPEAPVVDRKVKRHARREQLYTVIRECMTRAGVLAASYRFKVLSLDQTGDKFLVMMDVAPGMAGQADKLTEIETLLINTAKSVNSIDVTAVYWRTDKRPPVASAVNFGANQPAAPDMKPVVPDVAKLADKKASVQRYDPIHDDEMAAFRQALIAASARHPALSAGSTKSRINPPSVAPTTGFEDTEMPESSAVPALSATQYGDLN